MQPEPTTQNTPKAHGRNQRPCERSLRDRDLKTNTAVRLYEGKNWTGPNRPEDWKRGTILAGARPTQERFANENGPPTPSVESRDPIRW